MEVRTDSERVRLSRKLVLELLASSVDLSTTPVAPGYLERYRGGARSLRPTRTAERRSRPRPDRPPRRARRPHRGDRAPARQGRQRALRPRLRQVHPLLQVRRRLRRAVPEHVRNPRRRPGLRRPDLDRARHPAPRVPRASTAATASPSARPARSCSHSEHELREAGEWREDEQVVTETICPYCGVGCSLELHVQDNRIVKVTSRDDHDVTRGNLCIKGRFGFEHVQDSSGRRSCLAEARHEWHRCLASARRLLCVHLAARDERLPGPGTDPKATVA